MNRLTDTILPPCSHRTSGPSCIHKAGPSGPTNLSALWTLCSVLALSSLEPRAVEPAFVVSVSSLSWAPSGAALTVLNSVSKSACFSPFLGVDARWGDQACQERITYRRSLGGGVQGMSRKSACFLPFLGVDGVDKADQEITTSRRTRNGSLSAVSRDHRENA